MPHSLLLAVQAGTRLRLVDYQGTHHLLELQRGDLLVWRGDVFHGGVTYLDGNHRVHAHMDPAGYPCTPPAISFADSARTSTATTSADASE